MLCHPMTAVAAQPPSKRRSAAGRPAPTPAPTPPPDEGAGADDDATEGEWLFKQNDLVLGPVTAIVLVEKIKKGELDGDTPVARDGDSFRPMKLVRLFRETWQATVEEKRLAAEERAWQSAVTRARIGRAFVLLLSFALPATAAAVASRQIMIRRPWDDTPKWIAQVPPLVDLPQRPPEVKKPDPPPQVAAITPDATTEDDAEDSTKPADRTKPKKPKTPKPDKGDGRDGGKDGGSAGASPTSTPEPPPPAAVESLTNAQAVAPLKDIQADLKACFKAEMESNPDMPAQVVLSYTITEDGKAINVSLDARELRGRPVVPCVQKAVTTLRWPRFNGERKNVSVPFKLGKPKAPGQQ
jgi:hypothetical protein